VLSLPFHSLHPGSSVSINNTLRATLYLISITTALQALLDALEDGLAGVTN